MNKHNVRVCMNNKQRFAIIAPLIVIAMMYPIFQFFQRIFEETIGWYLGLATYWMIWGAVFPLVIIGKESVKAIIRPQKIKFKMILLVLFPILMASLYRFVPGMGYGKPNVWVLLLLLSTTFGNGFFEEVLWRGVYLKLFPENIVFRVIYPSIWFALWHYVPGSVHSDGNVIGLMIGSGLFGFYLAFLAKQTGTVWWSIVAHTVGGLVMVV